LKKKHSFLTKRPFAHRGLYSRPLKDYQIVPENSLEAFRMAIEKNYSIEMDIHFTKDFKIIVFHDFLLGRLTTKTGFISSKSLDYIKKAKLSDNLLEA
jgi:glycerophosphoryl diester phosphodiesterase